MQYQRHSWMTEPAKARSEIWRTIAGFVAILITASILNALAFGAVGNAFPDWARYTLLAEPLGNTPGAVLFLLFSFGLTLTATVGAAKLLHKRGLQSLIGPIGAALPDFWRCIRLLMILTVALFLIPSGEGEPLIANLNFGKWLALLPLALLGILVQVSTEEIMFRGYLQQQLAARFKSPIIWMLIPATLFALGHFSSENGELAPFIVIWALLFGVAAADLTARSGSLGPAIALHLVNNAAAMLLVAMPDSFSGLALYHHPFFLSDIELLSAPMLLDLLHLLVAWLTCRIAIRR
ncbi:MAG: lysostaphin resistance A-like protein [Paracoccaceae bacterium]